MNRGEIPGYFRFIDCKKMFQKQRRYAANQANIPLIKLT